MNRVFERRPLLERNTLRRLQEKSDNPSVRRFALHYASFLFLATAVVFSAPESNVAAFSLTGLLAAVWASLFAPFHETVHGTAFRSPWLNTTCGWLAGIPFGMAPAVYKEFHFDHHRFTQEPGRDPEVRAFRGKPSQWPSTWFTWTLMIIGWGIITLKVRSLVKLPFLSEDRWERLAPWARKPLRPRLVRQSAIVGVMWVVLIGLATWHVGYRYILFAAILSHTFQAVWVTTEHTGLPALGSILARTRTVVTRPFFRWWLWNMNFHGEHHAWPAVPWHALPELHLWTKDYLEARSSGYIKVHSEVVQTLKSGNSRNS